MTKNTLSFSPEGIDLIIRALDREIADIFTRRSNLGGDRSEVESYGAKIFDEADLYQELLEELRLAEQLLESFEAIK